jgi:hypothetical protein
VSLVWGCILFKKTFLVVIVANGGKYTSSSFYKHNLQQQQQHKHQRKNQNKHQHQRKNQNQNKHQHQHKHHTNTTQTPHKHHTNTTQKPHHTTQHNTISISTPTKTKTKTKTTTTLKHFSTSFTRMSPVQKKTPPRPSAPHNTKEQGWIVHHGQKRILVSLHGSCSSVQYLTHCKETPHHQVLLSEEEQ